MKKLFFTTLVLSFFLFHSCEKDFTKVEVTYTKATAIYGDLEDLRSQQLVSEARDIVNPGKIFVGENMILVGEEGEGIHWIDNTDPANPSHKLFINIPLNREFYVKGNTLYAESHYDMLKLDISSAEQVAIVSRVENAFSEDIVNDKGETLIGFHFEEVTEKVDENSEINQSIWGNHNVIYFDYINRLIPASAVPASFSGNSSQNIGTVNRIAYADEHVYVLGHSTVYSFADNGNLDFLGSNLVGSQMETIYPHDDHLFIGTRNSMMIMSAQNPAQLTHAGTFWHATSCDPVFPVGDVAYVTLRTGDFSNCPGDVNALVVLDIQRMDNPFELQEIEMESPFGMTKSGERLYVGEGANGLKVFDASNPRALELEFWEENIEAYDIIPHPNRSDMLLIASPNGLGQYEIEGGSTLGLISRLDY